VFYFLSQKTVRERRANGQTEKIHNLARTREPHNKTTAETLVKQSSDPKHGQLVTSAHVVNCRK